MDMARCVYCAHDLPVDARYCEWCLRGVEGAGDDVHGIPAVESRSLSGWQDTAVYELELSAKCPHCREPIHAVRVIRLTRTQVSFTSALPRGGRVVVCPQCEGILSAEVSGLP